MTERLQFDDRLLNPFATDDLADSHPELHRVLAAWYSAFGDFDDTSVDRLLAARGTEVERWRTNAEAAVNTATAVVATLDGVIAELEAATRASGGELATRLAGLLEAARANRSALTEQLPRLVAGALGGAAGYSEVQAAGVAAVSRAAERLAELQARVERPGQGFGELRPVIGGLRAVWAELDRSLSGLSRADQRAVRRERDGEMREAAMAICRGLYRAKAEDRAGGRWPLPKRAPVGDRAAARFAAALADGDFEGAAGWLAPWVGATWPASRLAEWYQALLPQVGGFGAPPVAEIVVEGSPLTLEQVRSSSGSGTPLAEQITEGNYRGWWLVRFLADEEDAYLTDVEHLVGLVVATVDTSSGERVGHFAWTE